MITKLAIPEFPYIPRIEINIKVFSRLFFKYYSSGFSTYMHMCKPLNNNV